MAGPVPEPEPGLAAAPPASVAWLGYGGLLPFLGLPLLLALDPARSAFWSQALLAYGAVILSFVGALHWALAMTLPGLGAQRRAWHYGWSVLPALLAWVALLLPQGGLMLLMLGLVAHYAQDLRLTRRLAQPGQALGPDANGRAAALPPWYLPLRLRLTLGALLGLLAGAGVQAGF